MKVFVKRKKLYIVMKKEDLKTLFVIVRYAITFILGLLGGATGSDVVTSLF